MIVRFIETATAHTITLNDISEAALSNSVLDYRRASCEGPVPGCKRSGTGPLTDEGSVEVGWGEKSLEIYFTPFSHLGEAKKGSESKKAQKLLCF